MAGSVYGPLWNGIRAGVVWVTAHELSVNSACGFASLAALSRCLLAVLLIARRSSKLPALLD